MTERYQDARATWWIEDVVQDARFAVRLLAKERWFSGVTILALALGIGVTSMVATIVNGYNLRGLPVDDPERVLYVGTRDQSGRDRGVAYPDYREWQNARSFASLGAFSGAIITIGDKGLSPESLGGAYVSQQAFAILGEAPILGRGFLPDDDQAGALAVVVLGHRLWASRYGSDPSVIGRSVTINGAHATIIGVMREGFEFPFRETLWLPLALLPATAGEGRREPLLGVFGRLAPGVGPNQARAELGALLANIATESTPNERIEPLVVRFGLQQVGRLGDQQPPLAAFATAMFVLLVACANVANLLLARSASRSREIAVRISIGATRWRIVRQLIVESLLLSLLAGALGIWLSRFGVQFVVDAFGRNIPYWMQFPVDSRVLVMLVGLCFASTLAFGLGPALIVSKTDAGGLMKEGGRTGTVRRVSRWTQTLLIGELAVTVVLLAGAGLMVRSFFAVYRADQVIDPSKVLTTMIALPEEEYRSADQRSRFYQQLDDRLGRIPGLAASLASIRPFTGGPSQRVSFPDRTAVPESQPATMVVTIGPRYFDTLGVPVLRGRYFTSLDGTPGHQAAVVNQRFVEMFFANEDPIGRVIKLSDEKSNPANAPGLTIVGVAPTIRQSIASGTRPVVYLPLTAHEGARASIVVGQLSDSTGIVGILRREIAAADADVTLFNVRPLTELMDDSRLQPRLIGTVIAVFASIALLLSVVGLYAVTAYAVRQRMHEIGIRMALGAQSTQVVILFLKRGMLPVGLGLAIGLVGAFAVGRLLQGLLIQTGPTDPVTLLSIAVLLVVVSVAACVVPARKAAKFDPLAVLRCE
jgi:putative ABC transport system permease protein